MMEHQNLVRAFKQGINKILLCKRRKAPYDGLLKLIGGMIECGEVSLSATYR